VPGRAKVISRSLLLASTEDRIPRLPLPPESWTAPAPPTAARVPVAAREPAEETEARELEEPGGMKRSPSMEVRALGDVR
jgi:hypothetical protein